MENKQEKGKKKGAHDGKLYNSSGTLYGWSGSLSKDWGILQTFWKKSRGDRGRKVNEGIQRKTAFGAGENGYGDYGFSLIWSGMYL